MTEVASVLVKKEQRLASAILELKQLRSAVIGANVDFFHRMIEIERDESLWRGEPGARTGYTTFAELLELNDICKAGQLTRFKAIVGRVGWDVIRKIGVEAAAILLPIPVDASSTAAKGAKAYVAITAELVSFVEKNQMPPTVQQTKAIAKRHYVATPAPRTPPSRRPEQATAPAAKAPVAQITPLAASTSSPSPQPQAQVAAPAPPRAAKAQDDNVWPASMAIPPVRVLPKTSKTDAERIVELEAENKSLREENGRLHAALEEAERRRQPGGELPRPVKPPGVGASRDIRG